MPDTSTPGAAKRRAMAAPMRRARCCARVGSPRTVEPCLPSATGSSALRPIRSFIPTFGGLDISPIIVILIIMFIQSVVLPNIARALI